MPRPESPVDPHAGPVQHFAFDPRKLRESAGSPGHRELGRATHYSPTTLADAVTDAEVIGQDDPALAAQLRLAAYRPAPLPEARDSLLSTFAAPYATRPGARHLW